MQWKKRSWTETSAGVVRSTPRFWQAFGCWLRQPAACCTSISAAERALLPAQAFPLGSTNSGTENKPWLSWEQPAQFSRNGTCSCCSRESAVRGRCPVNITGWLQGPPGVCGSSSDRAPQSVAGPLCWHQLHIAAIPSPGTSAISTPPLLMEKAKLAAVFQHRETGCLWEVPQAGHPWPDTTHCCSQAAPRGEGAGGAVTTAHPVPLAKAFPCPWRQAGVSLLGEPLPSVGVALTPETETTSA